MAELTVKVDSFRKNIGDRLNRVVDQALLRALNRTIGSTRVFLQRELSEKTNLKRKDLMKYLFFFKASYGNPSAALFLQADRVPLFQFGAKKARILTPRGKRIGVTAQVKGQRQLIPGAFLATMKSGKTGVWERKGERRLPIRQLFSSELSDLIRTDEGFLPKVQRYAQETFDKNFEADYNFYLERERLRG